MYIVIVGAGGAGLHVASLLSKERQEIVIVEQSEELAEEVRRQLDVGVVVGSATSPSILRQADVKSADLIVATTDSDETNMVVCFMAREMGAKKTVARVRNPEYSGYLVLDGELPHAPRRVVRPKSLGIDLFVNPEFEAAKTIVSMLSSLYVGPVEEFAEGHVQIREFKAESGAVVGKTFSGIAFSKPCQVVMIGREEEVRVPGDDEMIREGDRVYLIAASDDMDEVGTTFGEPKLPARTVVIFGGGDIGFHVAAEMERRGVQVKLIEKSASRSQEISARLKRAVVVQGGGPDRELLSEEGVGSSDAFIAATGDESLNILAGLVAGKLGVSRNVVLVDNPEYIPLAEAVGVDVAVSPLLLCANKIARFVLRGGAVSVALLANEEAQAIEFIAGPSARITGKKSDDLELPEGAKIGAIIHGDAVKIPPGESVVEAGDRVVIVSLLSSVPAVEKLFK